MSSTASDLFDRYHLAIYRYLLRLTGRADVAEDLTQDVFVRIVRGAEILDTGDRERAWLFRIARNLWIDRQRRLARSPVVSGLPEDCGSDARHDVALALEEALQQLPPEDSDVFLLRVVGGLGHEEIATVCGATTAAVRSRIFRARSALRQLLGARLSSVESTRPRGRAAGDVPRLKVVR